MTDIVENDLDFLRSQYDFMCKIIRNLGNNYVL